MQISQGLRYLILSVIIQLMLLTSDVLALTNLNNEVQGKPSMKLESTGFTNNDYIPIQYTGEGKDISPPLHWKNVPALTRSLALICDDPDAPMGTWDHWILYHISPTLDHIEEGGNNLPSDVRAGRNSWGKLTYGGPRPPSGTHHYHFTLYALNTELKLGEGATKDELKKAMMGHIIEETTLIGLYQLKHSKVH